MLIFTICARNYLAYALTLRESVREHEPDADFVIFLSDDPIDDPAISDFTIPMAKLSIPDLDSLKFRYDILELSTAIKPFCFNYAFDRLGHRLAVFLDPDVRLFSPLSEVRTGFSMGASCLLTPHLNSPLADDGKRPSNRDILVSGAFNLGFAAFADVSEARAFLAWWGEELVENCYVMPQEGLFVDQKFVDLAPGFLSRLSIIRHNGYNVAYWNLASRPVSRSADAWKAAGAPLVFFHFSGIDVRDADRFSKHQDRVTMQNAGDASILVRDYIARLSANGHDRWSKIAYAFDRFDDGQPIPLPVRRAFRQSRGGSDFSAYDRVYWNAPAPDIDQEPGAPISRLMAGYHSLRPDLQSAFPLTNARGRAGFHDWFIGYGLQAYGLTHSQLPESQIPSSRGGSRRARFLARMRLRLWRRSPGR